MVDESAPMPDVSAVDRASSVEEFDAMIEQLDGAIEVAAEKVESGRIYDPDNEQVRIKWIRVLGYLIRTKKDVWSDREVLELAERLEEIEEQRTRERYR